MPGAKTPIISSIARSFEPRQTLHNEVARQLGSSIAQGEIPPGATLPNEADLSLQFNVSRTVLREAVKVIASKGMVEIKRKTGTRVRPRGDWNMLDPQVLGWFFSGIDVSEGLADLLEVRRQIEPQAAALAAERATATDLEKIEAAYRGMTDATEDLRASVAADLKFHLAILEATHNIFMLPFGAMIQAALAQSFQLTNQDRPAYLRSLVLHRAVASAIRDRDSHSAMSAMLAVLDQTSEDIAHRLTNGNATSIKKHRRTAQARKVKA